VAINNNATHIPRGHVSDQFIRFRVDPFVILCHQAGHNQAVFTIAFDVQGSDRTLTRF